MGKERARAWPGPRSRSAREKVKEQNEWFRQAQWACKYWPADFTMQIREAVAGTPLLYRDLMTMIMANRAWAIELDDGRTIYPMPARQDVSLSLDVLGQTPGDVLTRGDTWWAPAADPEPGFVLSYVSPTEPAKWAPVAAVGGLSVIGTTVLAADAPSISWPVISDQYQDLVLSLYGRGTDAANGVSVLMRVNGSAAAIYDYYRLNSFAAANGAGQTSAVLGSLEGAGSPAGAANQITLEIAGYACATLHKSWTGNTGLKIGNNAADMLWQLIGGFIRTNSPIASLEIFPISGQFLAGTRATLYGRG